MASTPPEGPQPQLLEQMRRAVFDRKPILGAIIEKLGRKTLLEYVRGYTPVDIHPVMSGRQAEFLGTFRREVGEMFPEDIATRAAEQIARTFFVSTNDHHGPINAFDAFNAHAILALSAMEDPSPDRTDVILLFSCCNVSLNNISFPRGILYSTPSPEGIAARRLSLLPSNSHASALYGYRAYEPREVEKLLKLLREHVREKLVSPQTAAKLEVVIKQILGDKAILERKTYSAQASIINEKLWELVFKDKANAPILVSVGQERLVSRLLLDHHLQQKSLLHSLLFDPAYEKAILKHFDGIYGAFSTADKSGTYLFWGRNREKGMRIRMMRSGDNLVSEDGTISIPWNPESIAAALSVRDIIPSILLVFCTLSFYYGVKCLGGYSQVNYLTFMKEAFMAMLKELGEPEAADQCLPVSTKNWSGFSFAYAEDGKGSVLPAQFLDLYLYADEGMWKRLIDYAHVCTLEQAVAPILPEIYRYSYGEEERDPALMAITPQHFVSAAGLQPCIRVS
jgi:hypothetical protein